MSRHWFTSLTILGCPLLAGCLFPSPPTTDPEQANAVIGKWKGAHSPKPRHLGPGEGVLLLPQRGDIQLRVTIKPGRSCRQVGLLAGYRGPDNTHGFTLTKGKETVLAYFRRDRGRPVHPACARTYIDQKTWTKGFTLHLRTWQGAMQAALVGLTGNLTWHPLRGIQGRTALFCRGPAEFSLDLVEPNQNALPQASPLGLLRLLSPGHTRPTGTLENTLQAVLFRLAKQGDKSSPEERMAAWLWTGNKNYRPTPLTRTALLEQVEEILASQKKSGAWADKLTDPEAQLIKPGSTLLHAMNRLSGPLVENIFQAHRRATNRLIEAVQVRDGELVDATNWSTVTLLRAGNWLARGDNGNNTAIRNIATFLEETRLLADLDNLRIKNLDGRSEPGLNLLWARFLSRLGTKRGYEEYLDVARAVALLAVQGSSTTLRFHNLCALLQQFPDLAPTDTLAILDSTGEVQWIDRNGNHLTYTTTGPTEEVILLPEREFSLTLEGKSRVIRGPLVRVRHGGGKVDIRGR